MHISIIRQKLHNYLEGADEKKLKAIYAVMEKEIEEESMLYSEAFISDLEKRYAEYKAGESELVSKSQSKERIHRLLSSNK